LLELATGERNDFYSLSKIALAASQPVPNGIVCGMFLALLPYPEEVPDEKLKQMMSGVYAMCRFICGWDERILLAASSVDDSLGPVNK